MPRHIHNGNAALFLSHNRKLSELLRNRYVFCPHMLDTDPWCLPAEPSL